MGNRILKESICVSEDVNRMGWFVEAFYYRLIVNCDDYGRMDARPAILRARLFPLRQNMGLERIEVALAKLAELGCLRLYEVDGQPYLQLPAWEVHQRVRAKRARFPAPEEGAEGSDRERAESMDAECAEESRSECAETSRANVCGKLPQPAADGGGLRPESESESEIESESISEPEAEAEGGAARVTAAAVAAGMPFARRDRETVRALLSEYNADWVIEAIDRAADGPSRTWRYVRGILKRWKAGGGVDARGRPEGGGGGGKRVLAQMYTQRGYSDEELSRLVERV